MRVFGRALAWLPVVALLFSAVAAAGATRTWTDASGKFTIEAEFVDYKEGEVHLRKADGSVITVAAAKLSDADRSYLTIQLSSKSKTSTAAPSSPSAAPVDPAEFGLTKLADAEGKVSRTAWSKFTQAYRHFDVDADDAISRDELGVAGDADLLLKLVDSDGDGKLIRAEWSLLARNFARYDKNSDGFVAPSELTEAADAALAKSSGTASLAGAAGTTTTPAVPAGPTVWRGTIDGRGQVELTVNGNQIAGRDGNGGDLGSGTFTMTGNGALGNMDAVYVTGPNRGQICLGIYQLQGDTLRWCVSNRNGQRPQDFSGGNGNWLMTLTKVVQP